MTALPLLDVRNLTVEFQTRRGIVKAVQHVDLTVAGPQIRNREDGFAHTAPVPR